MSDMRRTRRGFQYSDFNGKKWVWRRCPLGTCEMCDRRRRVHPKVQTDLGPDANYCFSCYNDPQYQGDSA